MRTIPPLSGPTIGRGLNGADQVLNFMCFVLRKLPNVEANI